MSTALIDEVDALPCGPDTLVVTATGFPPARHPAEADCFARHEGVPGHVQRALSDARICIVGAGGLGGWTALALARSGAKTLTLVEPDRFERSNAARQLMFGEDLGNFKAFAVAQNVAPHMVAGGRITAIRLPFDEACERYAVAVDIVICLVDNNACRLDVVRFARARRLPAVFAMLSTDSVRLQAFLQEPEGACLWCALPNLDPEASAPCASASVISCMLAASHSAFLAHRALMGWPESTTRFNWRESDLLGLEQERTALVGRRDACSICSS